MSVGAEIILMFWDIDHNCYAVKQPFNFGVFTVLIRVQYQILVLILYSFILFVFVQPLHVHGHTHPF